jgi:hypothetical protein
MDIRLTPDPAADASTLSIVSSSELLPSSHLASWDLNLDGLPELPTVHSPIADESALTDEYLPSSQQAVWNEELVLEELPSAPSPIPEGAAYLFSLPQESLDVDFDMLDAEMDGLEQPQVVHGFSMNNGKSSLYRPTFFASSHGVQSEHIESAGLSSWFDDWSNY